MKILSLTLSYRLWASGKFAGGIAAYRLNRSLHALGHDITVLDMSRVEKGTGRVAEQDIDGVKVFALDLGSRQQLDASSPAAVERLHALLRDGGFDVVHLYQHEIEPSGLWPLLVSALPRTPIVATGLDYGWVCQRTTLVNGDGALCEGPALEKCRKCLTSGRSWQATTTRKIGSFLPGPLKGLPAIGPIARITQEQLAQLPGRLARWDSFRSRIDHWIAPSHAMENFLVTHGVPESKITHCPYGLDPPVTVVRKTNDGKIVIGWAGRPIYEKGFHLLVDTFIKLARAHPNVYLKIFGFDPRSRAYRYAYAECAKLLKACPDRILTARYRADRPEEIAAAHGTIHCMAVPSIWRDNFPLVAIESLAFGTPIIASAHSSAAEAITPPPHANGLTFDWTKPQSLLDALSRFVSDASLRATLYQNARYPRTLEDEARTVESVYARLLSRVPGGATP